MKTVKVRISETIRKLELIERRSNDGVVKLWARKSAKDLRSLIGEPHAVAGRVVK